ncbi:hypothetical protein FIBSPDRAFT_279806 [Athelia psychrophila]|uniref:Uncharacterized protein n=1 Tax=Athelia psychrophila TaxID=1759441 RepID=A0A165WJJ5_9AGAM|nr:hypothetical protein FIBSPDRAFT_279806 [Fibularhizoctonia sp. CBS 109695]
MIRMAARIFWNSQPFSSNQHRTRFQLHTTTLGCNYHEVKQIGDSSYPLTKHKNEVILRSQRLLSEQEANARPLLGSDITTVHPTA